jgi:hypothetical protein
MDHGWPAREQDGSKLGTLDPNQERSRYEP